MPQNKGLGGKYPSTFCEWVVGQRIEDAFDIRTQRPKKQREIIKVEVTTDDETEEDSLKITYPRSGPPASSPRVPESVKKVRFADAPRKSAMKKATVVSSESEDETSESSAATKSDDETMEAEKPATPLKKPPKGNTGKKSQQKAIISSDSSDSEPHPECKCARCARGRKRLKKCVKADEESESEESTSVADSTPKSKNQGSSKAKKKSGKKCGEEDESKAKGAKPDSAKAIEEDTEAVSTKSAVEKNKQEPNKQKVKKGQENKGNANQGGNKKGKAAKNKETAEPQPQPEDIAQKAADGTKDKSKPRSGTKKGDYPEAFPAPHPRRPNLIEPIRAEVVQTERVVESPEDPPPNAYYDPAHGILRVYHGPVYGRNQGYALYPRRDASGRPLHVGMPHPLQNPYYHGFNQAPLQQVQEHMPITQGTPVASYNASCPPPVFAPGFGTGFPQTGPPAMWQDPNASPNPNGNKGAFSMSGANAGPSLTKNKDNDGVNNVAPLDSVKPNPYYKPRISQFSTYGSRVPSHASQQDGANNVSGFNPANTGFPSNDGAGETGRNVDDGWGRAAQDNGAWNNVEQTQDKRAANGMQEMSSRQGGMAPDNFSSSQAAAWNNTDGGNVGGNGSNASNGAWGNGHGSPAGNNGHWDNQEAQVTNEGADGATSQWGHTTEANGDQPAMEANNVMPGSWDAFPAVPTWGDSTMAADSGGLVDRNTW